jgi:hypothetical protein
MAPEGNASAVIISETWADAGFNVNTGDNDATAQNWRNVAPCGN